MHEPKTKKNQTFQCLSFFLLFDGDLLILQGLETLHAESHRYGGFREPHDLDLSLLAVMSFCKANTKLELGARLYGYAESIACCAYMAYTYLQL